MGNILKIETYFNLNTPNRVLINKHTIENKKCKHVNVLELRKKQKKYEYMYLQKKEKYEKVNITCLDIRSVYKYIC